MKWIPPNEKWTSPKKINKQSKWTPPTKLANNTHNWKPPPVESICDERSVTQDESPIHPNPKSPIQNEFYYPLYSGWCFPTYPFIFSSPSHAAAWTISRFKRNGLSNIWGPGRYPDFLQYVGTIETERSNLEPTTFLTSRKPSQIEDHYFSGVEFFNILDPTAITGSSYSRLNNNLYTNVIATMKDTPDYFLSSTSIYRPKSLCVSSVSTDVEYRFSRFLHGKKAPDSAFIQLEQRVFSLRTGLRTDVYCSHGKNKFLFYLKNLLFHGFSHDQ